MPRNLNYTLTVKELINYLSNFDEDLPVVLQHDYGDRISTPEALFVKEPEEAFLSETSYSDTGWKVSDENNTDITVVVLSYDNSQF